MQALYQGFFSCFVLALIASCSGGASEPEFPGKADWEKECANGRAAFCASLMHEMADRPAVADEYGSRACNLGDRSSCEYIGNILFIKALAPTPHENAGELFRASQQPFSRACALDSWVGCVRLAAVLQETNGETSEQAAVARKGFTLVEQECDGGDPAACDFLAFWAERASDGARQKEALAKGCRALLEQQEISDREELIEYSEVCQEAIQLGVAPPDLRTGRPVKTLPTPVVPSATLAGSRISGTERIHPPEGVRREMAQRAIKQLKTRIALCLSKTGRVSSLNVLMHSGSSAYDRKLFETMRTWRYRPYMVEGEPTAACTQVTFLYRQG